MLVQEDDTDDRAVVPAPPGAQALTMPACVQTIVYDLAFQALYVRRQKLFTFMYSRACIQGYEHVCKTRLVCRQSAEAGKQSLETMKKLRVRASRYMRATSLRMYGRW